MSNPIRVKRGDTLSIDFTRTDSDGVPVDLTGMTIASQIRFTGSTVDLDVSITDAAAGQANLSKDAAVTAGFEIEPAKCDVEFTDGGTVISTETFVIQVVEDVTGAP